MSLGKILAVLFLIAAVVLLVIALIAAAAVGQVALGSVWSVWLCAAGLAYAAHRLVLVDRLLK